MKLKTLHLKNIKSYEDETIVFYDGVNFISGINGAGKSTLIESIGFVLFDSKPGLLSEFVRYGAKKGVITLEFEGRDQRLYRVVRKIGSVSSWLVFDGESGQEIDLHGAADIKPWLKECLGVEQEQDLAQLFTDVVGVSQGTFTAPFLDRPADRRQKFNRMLQVEAYNEAFLKSREINSYLQNLIQTEEKERARLLGQTEGYEEYKEEEATLLVEVKKLTAELNLAKEKLKEKIKKRDMLSRKKEKIQQNDQKLSVLEVELKSLEDQLQECLKNLRLAKEAAQTAEQAKAGYEQYVKLQAKLSDLEAKRDKRAKIEKAYHEILTQLKTIETEVETLQKSWAEQNKKNEEQLQKCLEELETVNKKVGAGQEEFNRIEAEAKEVQLTEERIMAKLQGSKPFETLSNRVANGLERWRELKEEIAKSREILASKEELEAKAKEVKKIQEEWQRAQLDLAALWEKINSLKESKEQVKDGLCPHLNEPCRNIQGNLEEYFAKQLEQALLQVKKAEKRADYLKKVSQEGEKVFQKLQALDLEGKKLTDSLNREELYRQTFRKIWQESLELDEGDVKLLLQSCQDLAVSRQKLIGDEGKRILQDLKAISHKIAQAWQDYRAKLVLADSFELDLIENLLERLNNFAHYQDELEKVISSFIHCVKEATLEERNNRLNQLNSFLVEKKNLEKRLEDLKEVKNELQVRAKSLEEKKLAINLLEKEKDAYHGELQKYESLDKSLEKTKQEAKALEESYKLFLKFQEEANKLGELQGRLSKLDASKKKKLEEEGTLRSEQEHLLKDFSQDKLDGLEQDVSEGQQEVSKKEAYLQGRKEKLKELQNRLAKMEEIFKQISLIEEKLSKYSKVKSLLDFIRNIFNHAGERVATVYREYLAQEASRIYREVSQENVALEWRKDYEVVLVDQVGGRKRERSFRQLSGGEQMTAALAVRLALLKQLPGIKVGFFDEPTTNLDGERRSHLASVIPKVTQAFDQLFIISHDDSFDAMTDNVIELSKDTGKGTKLKRLA